MERRLRPDEVAEVLRRAADLDAAMPGADLVPADGGLDGVAEGAVLDAAVEAGFRPESVSTALAELRAGALAAVPPVGCVVDQRPVAGQPATVERALERILDRERFTIRRRDGDRVTWVRSPRAWSDVLRLRRGPDLSALTEVSLTVAEVPGSGTCLVRAEALTDTEPSDAVVTGALGGGVGLAGGATLWAVSADVAFLVASVPVAAVLGVWRWRDTRREARRRAGEVSDALSRLLDATARRP